MTLSRQKRCSGTLQSSKCDADAPKYGARTFALLVSVQRAKVTQSSSGKEPSSAPYEKTQVTSQLWQTQAVRSTLLTQPLEMNDRQVLLKRFQVHYLILEGVVA